MHTIGKLFIALDNYGIVEESNGKQKKDLNVRTQLGGS